MGTSLLLPLSLIPSSLVLLSSTTTSEITSTSSLRLSRLPLVALRRRANSYWGTANLHTSLIIENFLVTNGAKLTGEMISATSLEGAMGILSTMSSRISTMGRLRSKERFTSGFDIGQAAEESRLFLKNSRPLVIVLRTF